MEEWKEVERYFYMSCEDFTKQIAKAFEVKPEDVVIDKGNKDYIYGFEIRYEVLTECVTVSDNRVLNALKLNKNYHFEGFKFDDVTDTIAIEVTREYIEKT